MEDLGHAETWKAAPEAGGAMKRGKLCSLFLAIAASAAFAAGCGSSSNTSNSSSSNSSSMTTAAKTATSAYRSTTTVPTATSGMPTATVPTGALGGGVMAAYCNTALAAAKTLTATEKSQFQSYCAGLANDNPTQIKAAEKTLCTEIIKETVPAAQQAAAGTACSKL